MDERTQSSVILQIDELNHSHIGRYVRLLGRVASIDASANILMLEYRGCRVLVDTTLLDTSLRVGDYRHILGLLQLHKNSPTSEANEFILRARLVVQLEGIDSDLYDRSLALRRRLDERLFGSKGRAS